MNAPDIRHDLAALVGTVLDDTYRLDQLIGEGGMGAVFRGRHVIMKRDFAIKVLHPDFNRDPELVRRFDREAQSAARLNHPNCIHVSAYGTTEDGMRYLVMQLLEGVELADLLTAPLDVRRVVDWSIQILRGLEHAHDKGVIHRDLKPQNVFLTRDHDGAQVLKLVDFGIAKIVGGEGASDPLTRAGMVFGTPQYMSPEQALGQEIDARADLYAVGILMFQMLTARLPFNHEDAIALIRMQVSAQPPPLPDSVPQDLAAIVFRLLAKQPEQRFPDARTVRLALERYAATLGKGKSSGSDPLLDVVTTAGPDLSGLVQVGRPLPEALRPRPMTLVEGFLDSGRWTRRPAFKIAVSVLVALVLALGAYLLFFAGAEPPPEPAPQVTQDARPPEPPAPTPEPVPTPPAETGPSPQELAAIDEHIAAGRLDEAQTAIDGLLERYPGNALLVWRDARQRGGRPGMHDAALRRYSEALKKAPDLARDPVFVADLDALVRQPPITDPAVSVARDLGPAGEPILLAALRDPIVSASLSQRRKVRDALAGTASAAQIDAVRERRLDLEQYSQHPDPCAGLRDAVQAVALEPSRDYIPALKAASVTPGPSPSCTEAAVVLENVRTDYTKRFPDDFAEPKPSKRRPKKKKRRR